MLLSSSELHSPQPWLWEGQITSLFNLFNPFAALSLAKTFYWMSLSGITGANCRYQSRLKRFPLAVKGFLQWVTCDHCSSFPSARTERRRKQLSPVTQTKPQLCLMCQTPTTALHTTNMKLRCWKHRTWRQQKIHNSTQISQRAVFCFYCLFFLINTIAFVQKALLSNAPCASWHTKPLLWLWWQSKTKCLPDKKLRISQHNLIPLWQQPHAYHRHL